MGSGFKERDLESAEEEEEEEDEEEGEKTAKELDDEIKRKKERQVLNESQCVIIRKVLLQRITIVEYCEVGDRQGV